MKGRNDTPAEGAKRTGIGAGGPLPVALNGNGPDAAVRQVTEVLCDTIDFVEQDLSLDLRRRLPDALLDIALARLVAREGRNGGAAILSAVIHSLLLGDPLRPGRPRDHRHDGHDGTRRLSAAASGNTVVSMR